MSLVDRSPPRRLPDPSRSARLSPSRRLALAVALLFAITSVAAFAAPSRTFAWDADSFSSTSEATARHPDQPGRASAGLKALRVDSTLTSVARWRSKDMIDRDYFSHAIPGYGKVWDKLDAIGYCYKVAGENIGWNNYPDDVATAAIQQMFMDSSGHRANILGKAWDVIGVGAYKGSDGKKMWTVLFADKCGTTHRDAQADPQADAQAHAEADAQPRRSRRQARRRRRRPTDPRKPTPDARDRHADAEPRPTAEPTPTPAPTPTPTPAEPTAPLPRGRRRASATDDPGVAADR